jgi:hypothetical protein
MKGRIRITPLIFGIRAFFGYLRRAYRPRLEDIYVGMPLNELNLLGLRLAAMVKGKMQIGESSSNDAYVAENKARYQVLSERYKENVEWRARRRNKS